jgi:putative transcriptional regulator
MAEQFQSLKGQLLLDGGDLRGSFFHRAVVLICNHDSEGAFGLVLSQPTQNKVGEVVLGEELPERVREQFLHIGGPVQTNALTFLYSDTFLDQQGAVIPNLALGTEMDRLVELGNSFSPALKLRCFAGYAGWTGGQLEGEMKRKAWLTHPASIEHVFADDPANLWKQILRQMGWKYRLLADAPEDLSWN